MAVKIGNKLIGETAREQSNLERKRFEQRQREKQIQMIEKEIRLRKQEEGSRKLSEFI